MLKFVLHSRKKWKILEKRLIMTVLFLVIFYKYKAETFQRPIKFLVIVITITSNTGRGSVSNVSYEVGIIISLLLYLSLDAYKL